MLGRIALLLGSIVAIVGYVVYYLYIVPDLPDIDHDKWWGEGATPQQDDDTIRPFKIEFNDTMINDLKSRLRSRRPFTRPLEGIQSEYGINTMYLDRVLNYWQDKYNFTERAARLNILPHFKTKIQGLDIHFIRARTEGKKKLLPILLMHGWPTSSQEFRMVLPMLLENRKEYDFGLEVIAVDLPGFGFSEGTNKPGMTTVQMGVIMGNLMRRLGFEKFYIHAGDWGSQVGTHMTVLYEDKILGFHTTMAISSRTVSNLKYALGSLFFPSLLVEEKYVSRFSPFKNVASYIMRESGYFHLQATKPDTIGAALTDTPVGLAAYLLEKIGLCCNRDQIDTVHGGLVNIPVDDLLDILTIMWATGRITTSTRIYKEGLTAPEVHVFHEIPTTVPTAVTNFQYEVVYEPNWVLRDKFLNIVLSNTHDFGGHFIALENPKALSQEILKSLSEIIKFNDNKVK